MNGNVRYYNTIVLYAPHVYAYNFNMGVVYTHLLSSDNVEGSKMKWTQEFKEEFHTYDDAFSSDMEDLVLRMFDYDSMSNQKELLQKISMNMDCVDTQPRCIFFATDLDYSMFAVVFYPGQKRICRYWYPVDFESNEFKEKVGCEDEDEDFDERLEHYQTTICINALRGKRHGWEIYCEDK